MQKQITVKMNYKGTVYEKGYGQVSRMVMLDRTIHATAKALYAYLCSYAGSDISEDRYAWPSVKTIMDDLGIKSEDTFQKYRKQLVDAGYMTIEQERDSDGTFKRNVYVIELIVQKKDPTPKKSGTVNRPLKNPSPIKSVPDKIGDNNKQVLKKNHLKDKNKNIYNSRNLPEWVIKQQESTYDQENVKQSPSKEKLDQLWRNGHLTDEEYFEQIKNIS